MHFNICMQNVVGWTKGIWIVFELTEDHIELKDIEKKQFKPVI